MKTQLTKLYMVIILTIIAFTQVQAQKEVATTNFYCNPMLLNSKLLDYRSINLQSKGVLSMVSGNPNDAKSSKVPFKVYLKRKGQFVASKQLAMTQDVNEIEISKILASAIEGDELIVEPAQQSDKKTRYSIIIHPINPVVDFNLLGFVKKDDC